MMRDINEVLRRKELDLQQLQREVEALRVAARLLSEASEADPAYSRPATASAYAPPARPAPPPGSGAGDAGYSAPWDAAAKKFP